MMKLLIVAFSLLLMAGISGVGLPSVFSEEEGIVMVSEISGQVVSVDQEASAVVIKKLKDQEKEIYEDITIYVDSMTTIEKDYETVGLNDLGAGDKAEVEYTTDDDGKNLATYIWIESN